MEQDQRPDSAALVTLIRCTSQRLTAAVLCICTHGAMTASCLKLQEELSRAQHAASAEQQAAQEAAEQRQQEADRLLREAQQEMQQQAVQIAALKARRVQEVQQT